jgi:hypothetical protein
MAGPAGPVGPFWHAPANATNGKEKQRANFKRTELNGILVPLPGIVGCFSVKRTEKFTTRQGHNQVEVEAIYYDAARQYLLRVKLAVHKILLIKIAGIDAFAG